MCLREHLDRDRTEARVIFPVRELAGIISGARRHALWPLIPDAPAPEGVHRVQRRGGKPVCHIRILTATPIELDTIDHGDARAAGYPTLHEYRDEWCRTHWQSWTGEVAWLLEFQPEPRPEQTRFLSRGDDYAYGRVRDATARDLELLDVLPDDVAQDRARRAYRAELVRTLDDAEAVDPVEVSRFGSNAHGRWLADRAQQARARAMLPLHVQLDLNLRDAKAHHIDVSSRERRIRREIELLAQQIARTDERAA